MGDQAHIERPDHKLDVSALKGVPESLLMTLYMRAVEAEHPEAVLVDELAIQIMAHIDYNFEDKFRKNSYPNIGIVIRSRLFDEATQAIIDLHPETAVVNLGVGLDTRFFRLQSNRELAWYELDYPQVLDLRAKIIPPPASRTHTYLRYDVMDFAWMDELPHTENVLFIAEGLLLYFPEDQVRRLMIALADRFPGSRFVFDLMGPMIIKSRRQTINPLTQTTATLQFGSKDPHLFERWDPRIHVEKVWSCAQHFKPRWGRAGFLSNFKFLSDQLDIKVVQVALK